MNLFVLRIKGDGQFVADVYRGLYTHQIDEAALFTNRAKAERERCAHEVVVDVTPGVSEVVVDVTPRVSDGPW